MKTILVFGMVILLFGAMAQAADFTSFFNQASTQLVGQELTGPVGKLFGNERINIYLKVAGDKTIIFSVVTKNKKVDSFDIEELNNPTLKVFTDEATLLAIASSSNPADALKSAVGNKKITYQAIGFFNRMKIGMIAMFVKFPTAPVVEDVSASKKADDNIPGNAVVVKNEDAKPNVASEPIEKEKVLEKKDLESKNKVDDAKEDAKSETKVDEKKSEEMKAEKKETVVSLTAEGFVPNVITIKVGDTVKWEDTRSSGVTKAMVLGTKQCVYVKSSIFNSGQSFSWTFKKPETCVFVDGIYTTQTGMVIIEK